MRGFIAAAAVAVAAACATAAPESDEAALRALDAAYADAWKREGTAAQSEAVLALFHDDAVIMPGLGTDPSYGIDAIRAFWFPEGAPPTVTTVFTHTPDGVVVDGDLGVISGRYVLRFTYGDFVGAQEGNYVSVARRGDDGTWRFARMTWNDRAIKDDGA